MAIFHSMLFRVTLFALVFFINTFLGVIVYLNDKKSATNKLYLLLSIVTSLWLVSLLGEQIARTNNIFYSIYWPRLIIFFASVQCVLFFFLSVVIPDKVFPKKPFVTIAAIASLLAVATFIFSPYIFKSVELVAVQNGGLQIVHGPLAALFPLYVSIVYASSIYVLIRKYRLSTSRVKQQFKLMIIGIFLTSFFLTIFVGVPATLFTVVTFLPLAPVIFLFFLVSTAIAILKYELFNIKVIITEFFVGLLNFLLLLQLILSNSVVRATVNFLIFLLGCVVSVLLIKNSRKELKQTEERVRVESLQEANRQLQELDRQKTEFLTIAAHQLRTPVSIIKNYIAMLQDGDYGKVSEEVQEIHKNIGESSEWLVRLGDEFLNIAHLEQGQTKYHMSVGDVSLVVDSVINELKGRAAHKKINLAWQRPTESMHTKMDEEKIRNVIFNFVDNAIKYSDAGTVAVNASVEHKRILVRVTDEGIGFTKVDHDKLFKKFQRGDNARKREVNSSSGLGLYIARMFVEGHGGEVWAQSKGLGKGSEFGLWIPIHV